MEALKYKTVITQDGTITITGAPIKKGQEIELIILVETPDKPASEKKKSFSAIKLKTSGFKFDRDMANER